jgi:hypothetical protein
MPYKDPEAAKLNKRAYYLSHKDKWTAGSARTKLKRHVEMAAKKAAEAAKPKIKVVRFCESCGADITDVFVSKHGLKCKACVSQYNRAYRATNAERIAVLKAQWKASNKARVAANDRAYALANPEKKTVARKAWATANPGKNTAVKALSSQFSKKREPTWLS